MSDRAQMPERFDEDLSREPDDIACGEADEAPGRIAPDSFTAAAIRAAQQQRAPTDETTANPPAELRAAADHMREHHPVSHPRWRFWREVAGWLDREAEKLDSGSVRSWREFNRALDAARAYTESVEG